MGITFQGTRLDFRILKVILSVSTSTSNQQCASWLVDRS
jgi:hypothetical protein